MIKPQKKFNGTAYKKNDMAFEALQKHFQFLYPVLREEDFNVDVAIYNGKNAYEKGFPPICYVEIETKYHWAGRDFPRNFKDIQFLAKKHRFGTLEHPVYWILFNRDCTNATIINFKDIMTCELDIVTCNNPEIGDDYFYRIPLNKMTWGIENLERFLIHDAFRALNNLHKLYIS